MLPHERYDWNGTDQVSLAMFLQKLVHKEAVNIKVQIYWFNAAVSLGHFCDAWLSFKIQKLPVLHVTVVQLLCDSISFEGKKNS